MNDTDFNAVAVHLTMDEMEKVGRMAKPLQVAYAEKILDARRNLSTQTQTENLEYKEPEYEECWMTPKEMKDLPPVEWLLPGCIPKRGFCELVAESGAGKSGVALDWAIRLADQGRRIMYVAAEGFNGLGGRIRAWEKATGLVVDTSNLAFLKQGYTPNLSEADSVRRFMERISLEWRDTYDLVILDTFAQMFSADENAAKDVGLAIKACAQIQQESGAAVLLVHHTGWDKSRQRGSSAIYAACDAVIHMEVIDEKQQISKVYVQKMKDGHKASPTWVQTFAPDPSHPDECCIRPIEEPATTNDQTEAILNFLNLNGPASQSQIVSNCPVGKNQVKDKMSTLALQGLVRSTEGPKNAILWEAV